jgi:hypothetical protein
MHGEQVALDSKCATKRAMARVTGKFWLPDEFPAPLLAQGAGKQGGI